MKLQLFPVIGRDSLILFLSLIKKTAIISQQTDAYLGGYANHAKQKISKAVFDHKMLKINKVVL